MPPLSQWAESPTAMGSIAHFVVDPLSVVTAPPRATLEGMPPEILLQIVSFLPGPIKTHPRRGRWGFEQLSRDVLRLSSTCSTLYAIFRPLRFRSLTLGGGPKSLAFVRLLLEDVSAIRLIKEIEIHSMCPLHGELDEPYAELIRQAIHLESFWFDASHPLPGPIAQALRRLKHADLKGIHVTMSALLSIKELAKTRSWKKGGTLEGLRSISLEQQDNSEYVEMADSWLVGVPPSKWEQTEHALLHSVSAFLAHSASTLEELSLAIDPRFDTSIYGHDLPLRTMLSDPGLSCPSTGSSLAEPKKKRVRPSKDAGCDVESIRRESPLIGDSRPLQLPLLRKLILPATDLRGVVVREMIVNSPLLDHLEVTHRPISLLNGPTTLSGVLSPLELSRPIDLGGKLGRLRTLVYTERSTSTLDGLHGAKSPFYMQVIGCVNGVGLTSLTLRGLRRVSAEELAAVGEGCRQLRTLSVSSAIWANEISAFREMLSPLKELVKLSIDYPPEQTDPPDDPPPVQALILDPDEDRLTAADVMDEIDAYFYDGAEDSSDDDDETDEDDSDRGTVASSDASWKTGLETVTEADEADDWHSARGSESGHSGDAWTRGRDLAEAFGKAGTNPAFVALPPSLPASPAPLPDQTFVLGAAPSAPVAHASSSASSSSTFSRSLSPSPSSSSEADQTVHAGRWQNDNLFHFSGIAHAFATQHPKLETVEWIFDGWFLVDWTVHRESPDQPAGGGPETTQVEHRRAQEGVGDERSPEKVTVDERVLYPQLMELYRMEEMAVGMGSLLM